MDRTPESLPRRLREHYQAAADADPAVEAILTEACRIIERLNHINAFESGKSAWIELLHFRADANDEQEVHVFIDKVVAEARQLALALNSLVAKLPRAAQEQQAGETGQGARLHLVEFQDRIAQRVASAQGRNGSEG